MDEKLSKRLNRLNGQITGIQKMLEAERDCVEVFTQIQAARAGLAALAQEVISTEAACCVTDDTSTPEQVARLKTLVQNLFKID